MFNLVKMSYYECKRCNYKVRRNSDMKRHLDRKIKCPKNIESYKLTDEEIYDLSMIINKDNKIKNIIIKKDNICQYCSKVFSRLDNLKKHEKSSCKKNILLENNLNTKSNNILNITNIEHKTHIENQTNNIIIINSNNVDLKPFDNNWATEHIDSYLKQIILLSENKYTDLLDEILKNKSNLNVIIEKDSSYGLVYKNDNDMYVNMKVKEIVDKSIHKLYDQLNVFYSSLINNSLNKKINSNLIENEKKNLDNKFEKFCNNDDIKNIVSNLLTNIYEKNKTDALEIADKILFNNKKIGF